MNENRQMEVHYINTGFPYSATESFMDFFEEINHMPVNYTQDGLIHDQENPYWPMNMHAYKFGFPGSGSTSYYCPYDVNNNIPRMDVSQRAWEYPSMMNTEEPTNIGMQPEENIPVNEPVVPEQGIQNQPSTSSSEGAWQDDVDPDSMTYEELLDLGETVGSESRGLPQELISLLPTSKCKLGSLFSRKKSGERCVICQMRYKIGERQIKLPCKHVYHSECITKWLGINKICPVCNNEVFSRETRH